MINKGDTATQGKPAGTLNQVANVLIRLAAITWGLALGAHSILGEEMVIGPLSAPLGYLLTISATLALLVPIGQYLVRLIRGADS